MNLAHRTAGDESQLRGAVASLAARIADDSAVFRVPEGADASPLNDLAASFDLEPVDVALLVAAAAPELDARLAALLEGRTTVGRAFELVGADPWSAEARSRLSPMGPLVRHALVHVDDGDRPFPMRPLRVPDRVVRHLLDDDAPDAALVPLITPLIAADVDGTTELARAIRSATWLAWVRERPGTAGWALAAGAYASLELLGLGIDLSRLPDGQGLADVLAAARREAVLRGAGLVIGPVDGRRDRAALARIGDLAGPIVLIGAEAWDPRWSSMVPYTIDATGPTSDARATVWRTMLRGVDAEPAPGLSAFRLAPEQIAVATRTAATQAAGHGRAIEVADLYAGVRAQNAGRLDQLARRIEPVASYDQLVLRDDQIEELRGIVHRVRTSDVVRNEWGMGGGGADRGRGVTCLFAGPSGVGKTLSAEVLARDLGVDLYTIDLSQVVDKYIGETEKNLERIFTEAEGVNGVLFFDEADALFGKRSGVQSAHDRHANVEVAYLLQRMERFDGVAVLATNLRGNLDEAFTRRIDVILQFTEPDEEERLRLWKLHLPPSLPLDDDVDVPFLSKAIDVTGGVIRNITLAAAYAAATESRHVAMADLINAIRREYRKVGRLVPAGALDDYLEDERAHD